MYESSSPKEVKGSDEEEEENTSRGHPPEEGVANEGYLSLERERERERE